MGMEGGADRGVRATATSTSTLPSQAAALLALLAERGLTPTPEERAHIAACTDETLLARWVRRAVTALSVADLFCRVDVSEAILAAVAEATRTTLKAVLDTRNLKLSAAEKARITSCTDDATLVRWLGEAAQAEEIKHVFNDP